MSNGSKVNCCLVVTGLTQALVKWLLQCKGLYMHIVKLIGSSVRESGPVESLH